MSINVRNHHNPDPFIFNGKSESYDHDIYSPRSSPWGSPSPPNGLISFYHQTQPQSRDGAFDQFCPSTSSGPSSPASGDNNLAYNLYSVASPYALDAADHFHIKDEPFDEAGGVFEADYFGGAGGLPPLDAASEAFANIPLLNSQDFDDERYQDFMQAFGVDAFAATAPPEPNCSAVQLPLNFLAFTALMDGMNESDDGDDDDGETTTTPGGSVSDSRQSSIITAPSSSASAAAAGRPVRPNAAASRATRMKKENGSKKRVDFAANVCSKLDSLRAAAVTSSAGPATASSSRRTSVASMSPSMSITSNTSDEDLPGGGHSKSSKRSSKSISPEVAYVRRREKNNIAVRKSREKKRQEIKRFTDEHAKLKREVDQVRAQNEKLRHLVTVVEDGIVGEKSKTELEALIKNAKKQLHWT